MEAGNTAKKNHFFINLTVDREKILIVGEIFSFLYSLARCYVINIKYKITKAKNLGNLIVTAREKKSRIAPIVLRNCVHCFLIFFIVVYVE